MSVERRDADVAGHRRLLPRAVFRRFEVGVWVVSAVVVAATVTVAVQAVSAAGPGARVSARFIAATPSPDALPACIFDPCNRPVPSGEPTRIRIPLLGVESPLEALVLDARGALEPPKSYDQAGWFRDGVVPGDAGPAVIAGHVDSVNGPAVFYKLHTLQPGDAIEVQRGGQWITFRVATTEQYSKNQFPTGRVYQPTPDAELRLITCGGDFDRYRQSYRDNIVVYAVVT